MSCMRITKGPIQLLKKNRELRTTTTSHEKFTQGYSKFVLSSYTAKFPEEVKRPRYGTGSLSPPKNEEASLSQQSLVCSITYPRFSELALQVHDVDIYVPMETRSRPGATGPGPTSSNSITFRSSINAS